MPGEEFPGVRHGGQLKFLEGTGHMETCDLLVVADSEFQKGLRLPYGDGAHSGQRGAETHCRPFLGGQHAPRGSIPSPAGWSQRSQRAYCLNGVGMATKGVAAIVVS